MRIHQISDGYPESNRLLNKFIKLLDTTNANDLYSLATQATAWRAANDSGNLNNNHSEVIYDKLLNILDGRSLANVNFDAKTPWRELIGESIDTYAEMTTDKAIAFFTNPANTKFRMHTDVAEDYAFWFKDSDGDTFFFDDGVITASNFKDDANQLLMGETNDGNQDPVWWIIRGTDDTTDPDLFNELYDGQWADAAALHNQDRLFNDL